MLVSKSKFKKICARFVAAYNLFEVAYWISSNYEIYRSSNFAIAKLSLLTSLLNFLYKFCRLVHSFFSVLLPIQLSLFQLLRQLRAIIKWGTTEKSQILLSKYWKNSQFELIQKAPLRYLSSSL